MQRGGWKANRVRLQSASYIEPHGAVSGSQDLSLTSTRKERSSLRFGTPSDESSDSMLVSGLSLGDMARLRTVISRLGHVFSVGQAVAVFQVERSMEKGDCECLIGDCRFQGKVGTVEIAGGSFTLLASLR